MSPVVIIGGVLQATHMIRFYEGWDGVHLYMVSTDGECLDQTGICVEAHTSEADESLILVRFALF